MEVVSQQRKHFTFEKKQAILKEHHSLGIPVTVLARKYRIHAITQYPIIDPIFIQKRIEENDRLKDENHMLKAKAGGSLDQE